MSSTPHRVLDEPDLLVQLPELDGHQVALLLRGLDRLLEVMRGLCGDRVRTDPSCAREYDAASLVRINLAFALAAWARANGHARVAVDDTLAGASAWPTAADPVPASTVRLVELWQVRRAVDHVAVLELDAGGPGAGFAPLAATHAAITEALAAAEVDAG